VVTARPEGRVPLGRDAARRLARFAGRAARGLVQVGCYRRVWGVVGLVVTVAVVRAWAGVWPAAVVGAVVATVGLVAGWAAVERRHTPDRRVRARPVQVERGPRGPGRLDAEAGHVAFARGWPGCRPGTWPSANDRNGRRCDEHD
jgi:hypothetical protein